MLKLIVEFCAVLSLFCTLCFGKFGNPAFVNHLRQDHLLRENGSGFCEAIHEDSTTLKDHLPGTFFFRRLANGTLYINYIDSEARFRIASLPWDFKHPDEGAVSGRWNVDTLASIFERKSQTEAPLDWKELAKYFPGLDHPLRVSPNLSIEGIKQVTPLLASGAAEKSVGAVPTESKCYEPSAVNNTPPCSSDFKPIYCENDPVILTPKGSLSIKQSFNSIRQGTGFDVTLVVAEQKFQEFLETRPSLERSHFHGSQVFHGSNSSSLLAFTKYGKFEGELLPVELLLERGRVPYSGELFLGRPQGSPGLSTTWIGGISSVLDYYLDVTPWNFKDEKESLKQILNLENDSDKSATALNLRNIVKRRLEDWGKLEPNEKALVAIPFPVIYGIRPSRIGSARLVESEVPGEILIEGGAKANEIRVIFVPQGQISKVREILTHSKHQEIAVEPIEPLVGTSAF